MPGQCANGKKGFIKREDILEANMKTIFSLIWAQCTKVLRANIQAVLGFKDVVDEADSLELWSF